MVKLVAACHVQQLKNVTVWLTLRDCSVQVLACASLKSVVPWDLVFRCVVSSTLTMLPTGFLSMPARKRPASSGDPCDIRVRCSESSASDVDPAVVRPFSTVPNLDASPEPLVPGSSSAPSQIAADPVVASSTARSSALPGIGASADPQPLVAETSMAVSHPAAGFAVASSSAGSPALSANVASAARERDSSPGRGGSVVSPPVGSPGRNKQLFLQSVTPQAMTCNLSKLSVSIALSWFHILSGAVMPGIGVKLNLVAIVCATFPVQLGPPARRHVMLCDAHGVTGLTVWHADVNKFPREVLGGVVTVLRASVSIYQGKKSLVLNKDSSIEVDAVTTQSPAAMWWKSLAEQRPLSLADAQQQPDNSVISVYGVLAFVSNETKEVNGVLRNITTVHLASQTAKYQLRGWDLHEAVLSPIKAMTDCVVAFRRVRVTSFATVKLGEILDSPMGTLFTPFEDPVLSRFWAE